MLGKGNEFCLSGNIAEAGMVKDNGAIDIIFGKAKSMLKEGSYLEAVGMFQAVLVLDSGNVKAMNNLAVSYYNLGYPDKAFVYFKKVLELDPNNAIALKNVEALREDSDREDN